LNKGEELKIESESYRKLNYIRITIINRKKELGLPLSSTIDTTDDIKKLFIMRK